MTLLTWGRLGAVDAFSKGGEASGLHEPPAKDARRPIRHTLRHKSPSHDAVEMMPEGARSSGVEFVLSLDESLPRYAKRFACTSIRNALEGCSEVHAWGRS